MSDDTLIETVLQLLDHVRDHPTQSVLEATTYLFGDQPDEGDDGLAVFVVFSQRRRRHRQYSQYLSRGEWRAVKTYYHKNRSAKFTFGDDDAIGHEVRTPFADLIESGDLNVYDYDKDPLRFMLATTLHHEITEGFDIRVSYAGRGLADDTTTDTPAPPPKRTIAETTDVDVTESDTKRNA